MPLDPANPPLRDASLSPLSPIGDPSATRPYAGLLIDEWPERIPAPTGTASVAFHYEEPARARRNPRCSRHVPTTARRGTRPLVGMILEETLDLAKIRTVDLDSIREVGQILPTLYFGLNLHGATVSMHLVEREVHLVMRLHPARQPRRP